MGKWANELAKVTAAGLALTKTSSVENILALSPVGPSYTGPYADPKNEKYPIDAEHVVAAWAYINVPKNAALYPLNGVTLKDVKASIKAAMKKFGHEVSE